MEKKITLSQARKKAKQLKKRLEKLYYDARYFAGEMEGVSEHYYVLEKDQKADSFQHIADCLYGCSYEIKEQLENIKIELNL
jgi:hypothetical protein